MSQDISTAFAHPSARSETLAENMPRDRISMTEHVREVEIGAFQPERGVTQTIRFDVVVEVDTRAETAADDVDRILSYDTIVEAIDAALEIERVNLLETLAARIADGILAHPLAARVFVRIGKLDRGPYTLGVEIVRDAPLHRRSLGIVDEHAPHPNVVFLSNQVVTRPDLSALLDRLEDAEAPLILCVDKPDEATAHVDNPMAQRRIDLLAIEQSAWHLAARDTRCVVVDSRTELDWAMRNGRISVWAPSKLVLDAQGGPGVNNLVGTVQGLTLAHWLAQEFQAESLVEFGVRDVEESAVQRGPFPILRYRADAMPMEDWARPTP